MIEARMALGSAPAAARMVRHAMRMTETTMTKREANQQRSLDAFLTKKAQFDALLAELRQASADHFGADVAQCPVGLGLSRRRRRGVARDPPDRAVRGAAGISRGRVPAGVRDRTGVPESLDMWIGNDVQGLRAVPHGRSRQAAIKRCEFAAATGGQCQKIGVR